MYYPPQTLQFTTVFLTVSGRARVDVGQRAYAHQPDSLVVIANGCTIDEQVELYQPWHVCYFHLPSTWAEQLDNWLRSEDRATLWLPSFSMRGQYLFRKAIDTAINHKPGWQWSMLGRIAEWLGILYAYEPVERDDALVARLGNMVDASPTECISIEQMAGRLELTPRQLNTRFARLPMSRWRNGSGGTV